MMIVNRKDIFMTGFKSKLGFAFTRKDMEEFETIIDFYEKENARLKDKIEKVIDYVNSDEFEQLFESCANFNEANCNINHFLKEN